MNDLIEIIKALGIVGGIASSVFLIYDRFTRAQPTVSLRPHDANVRLQLFNNANEPIIIDRIEAMPHVIGFSKADDTHSLVEAAATAVYPKNSEAPKIFVMVGPLEKRDFGIMRMAEFEKLSPEAKITIRVYWRNTRKPLPFDRHVKAVTTVGDLKRIREIAFAEQENKNSARLTV